MLEQLSGALPNRAPDMNHTGGMAGPKRQQPQSPLVRKPIRNSGLEHPRVTGGKYA